MNASEQFENLDWLIIEAFEQRSNPLKAQYWDAAKNIFSEDDKRFAKFLEQSGIIDNTLKCLWQRYKTPEAVKQQIRKNKLDKLAKYYNLQNQFNEAYTKYKRLPA